MSHWRRLVTTIAAALAALVAVTLTVRAASRSGSDLFAATERSLLDDIPGITIVQTVTLLGPPEATAQALTSVHETAWSGFGNRLIVRLPADVYSITVGSVYELLTDVNAGPDGFGEVFTRQIMLTPTGSLTTYLSYYTNIRAVRQGSRYRLPVHVSLNNPFLYQGTLVFTAPLEFVGYLVGDSDNQPFTPAQQSAGQVWWGPISFSPSQVISYARFDRDVLFGDIDLPIDLTIQSYRVITAADQRSVQVTATVANIGSVSADAPIIVELYDRPAGAPDPADPLDHAWGACRYSAECSDYRPANYYRYSGTLAGGQTIPVTFNYTFEVAGRRNLYLQVDSSVNLSREYGSLVGFNLEPDEGEVDNIKPIGSVQAKADTYLPLILKMR